MMYNIWTTYAGDRSPARRCEETVDFDMHALILIAQGSRREASNRQVRQLAAKLEQRARQRFDRVLPAFLELAGPDIQTAVDLCAEAGAKTITAVPCFLSPVRYPAQDIPAELGKAARRHRTLTIYQSVSLGRRASLGELLSVLGLEADDQAGARPQQIIPTRTTEPT